RPPAALVDHLVEQLDEGPLGGPSVAAWGVAHGRRTLHAPPVLSARHHLQGGLERSVAGCGRRRSPYRVLDTTFCVVDDSQFGAWRVARTWSWRRPLVDTALPPSARARPVRSVKRPPASSTITRTGARSQ